MSQKAETTIVREDRVLAVILEIDAMLAAKSVNCSEAAAGLMILAAKGCAGQLESDEYIVNQFRKCLAAERMVYRQAGGRQ